MEDKKDLLLKAAKIMQLKISNKQCNNLLEYINLLHKWNRIYNLSGINNPIESVKKHLIDSLSIVPFIKFSQLLDVGSGAGLPGIIIAIMKPDVAVTVIDSINKKCLFMDYVKTQLDLNNLYIENSRVEKFTPKTLFPQITSRAFAGAKKTIELTRHLLTKDGYYVLMKGNNIDKDININAKVICHKIDVPFVANNRSILEIRI